MPWLASAAGRSASGILFCSATSRSALFSVSSDTLMPARFGALHLQFLQHQAVEHLLAQHVLRRQVEVLRAQALGDDEHLLVELARQHHALIDGGGDAVEQHARAAGLAGLGERGRGGGEGQARRGGRAKMLWKSCSCFSPGGSFRRVSSNCAFQESVRSFRHWLVRSVPAAGRSSISCVPSRLEIERRATARSRQQQALYSKPANRSSISLSRRL